MAWVLGRGYRFDAPRCLIEAEGVAYDSEAVHAGLAMLDAGGHFADGIISHEGARLGGSEFVSLDRPAVRFLKAQGRAARLLA